MKNKPHAWKWKKIYLHVYDADIYPSRQQKISIEARTYGFLAATLKISPSERGYQITHIETGYKITPEFLGQKSNLKHTKRIIEKMVDDMPEIDDWFKGRVKNGEMDKETQANRRKALMDLVSI